MNVETIMSEINRIARTELYTISDKETGCARYDDTNTIFSSWRNGTWDLISYGQKGNIAIPRSEGSLTLSQLYNKIQVLELVRYLKISPEKIGYVGGPTCPVNERFANEVNGISWAAAQRWTVCEWAGNGQLRPVGRVGGHKAKLAD
ncbi:hypothetical protein J6590_077149 [Homalodisca vitripennis]|nr:hypothetical protein J6590_077149 [Homalodisca vitripennis]